MEKIFEKHIYDKELVLEYIRKSYNLVINGKKSNLKMGKGSEYTSSKKIHT